MACDATSLHASSKRDHADRLHLSRNGALRMLDAGGLHSQVIDWQPCKGPGGALAVAHFFLRSVFAQPVCMPLEELHLDGFRRELAAAIRSRYALDTGPELELGLDLACVVESADSYLEAIDLLYAATL